MIKFTWIPSITFRIQNLRTQRGGLRDSRVCVQTAPQVGTKLFEIRNECGRTWLENTATFSPPIRSELKAGALLAGIFPVFWSLLASYLFIDVISNLGKLLKLECDIKLALLLRWLVRRVFTRCSLCALPYIFSFRFREVNLQIAEGIWRGSPRKWSWNGGVVSVESIFIRPGERPSSHLLEWLAKRGALGPVSRTSR